MGVHLSTDTQTLIITDGIHHTGGLHCIGALPHILGIAVGLNHVHHTELLI